MPPKKRLNRSAKEKKTTENITDTSAEEVSQALKVQLTQEARAEFLALRTSDPVRFEKVRSTLQRLAENPRHPSLKSHEYRTKKGSSGSKLWESYVENKTPAAYRIFWHYGPDARTITVVAITPHP